MNENQNMEAARPKTLDVEVKIFPTAAEEDSKRLATASVTLGGCFVIRGVAIVDSDKGAFVSMPQRKDAKGEYHDICFPVTKEMRETIHSAVLDEYQKTAQRAFSRAGETLEKRASTLEKLREKQSEIPAQDASRGARTVNKGAR